MGFFLETLLGGLMAGMLYSLVALGFVLIYKASGVFNFAQGAMVLFAALAMARFAEWVPLWTGMADNRLVTTSMAFVLAGGVMFVVAWTVERLVLRHRADGVEAVLAPEARAGRAVHQPQQLLLLRAQRVLVPQPQGAVARVAACQCGRVHQAAARQRARRAE